jgi:hypothetical protein
MSSGNPNFFVIGAQKAGTTFLCHHLAAHPKVQFSTRKETFFFGKLNVTREDYGAYLERFFPSEISKPDAIVLAEGSATYFQSSHARKNMQRLLGDDFKVMVSLRDPVTKTISWYMHNYIRGRFDRSHPILNRKLMRRSRQATHIARWHKAIGAERVRAVTYDMLKDNPLAFVNGALEYLNLEPFTELSATPVNAGFKIVQRGDYLEPVFDGPDVSSLPAPRFPLRDIADLHTMLREDIRRTQDLTGLDLSKWLAPPVFEQAAKSEKAAA